MPRGDKNYSFYGVPLPQWYRKLSSRKRLFIEISVGVAVLALIPIGVSVQMPHWLLVAGWAYLVVWSVAWSILLSREWRRRQVRGR
jgi:hypothetical protein